MIDVGKGNRKCIAENRSGFSKANTVLASVSGFLARIPCEFHPH
jgi:hypothetical protein